MKMGTSDLVNISLALTETAGAIVDHRDCQNEDSNENNFDDIVRLVDDICNASNIVSDCQSHDLNLDEENIEEQPNNEAIQFYNLLREAKEKLHPDFSADLLYLAEGPYTTFKEFNGYFAYGYKFHTVEDEAFQEEDYDTSGRAIEPLDSIDEMVPLNRLDIDAESVPYELVKQVEEQEKYYASVNSDEEIDDFNEEEVSESCLSLTMLSREGKRRLRKCPPTLMDHINDSGTLYANDQPENSSNQVSFDSPLKWKEVGKNTPDTPEVKAHKFRSFCFQKMRYLYRKWKSELYGKYKKYSNDEERMQNIPPELEKENWKAMLDIFGSPTFLMDEETGKLPLASSVWLAQHQMTKDGVYDWHDMQSKEIYNENSSNVEDVLIEILGAKSGYVCGKGLGYKPKNKVFAKTLEHLAKILRLATENIHWSRKSGLVMILLVTFVQLVLITEGHRKTPRSSSMDHAQAKLHPVQLTIIDKYVMMDNKILKVTLAKPKGFARGYWDMVCTSGPGVGTFRYIVLSGRSGFYSYAIFEKEGKTPAFFVDQIRLVFKPQMKK
ncbi:Rhamnogalacturonate lyase [Dillenia turbinata]|uniref:Rhamnogalacturonate lyase n=1 Tax=Dillenia turbinata TaxID=194707 RepID=A0AAN8UYN8_9MAGN